MQLANIIRVSGQNYGDSDTESLSCVIISGEAEKRTTPTEGA